MLQRPKYNNMDPDPVDFFGECMNSPQGGRTPLANEIYEEKNVSIDDIKQLTIDEFYNWYNNGREIGNSLEISSLDEREVD